jgi:hypothetical protein
MRNQPVGQVKCLVSIFLDTGLIKPVICCHLEVHVLRIHISLQTPMNNDSKKNCMTDAIRCSSDVRN